MVVYVIGIYSPASVNDFDVFIPMIAATELHVYNAGDILKSVSAFKQGPVSLTEINS